MSLHHLLEEDIEDTLQSDINMIPFIDIMLVLLVIFMLTMPTIYHIIPFDLPKVEREQTSTQVTSLQINLTKDGTISLDSKPLSLKELKQKLLTLKQPTIQVNIGVEKDARYEDFTKIINLLDQTNYKKVHLQTQ